MKAKMKNFSIKVGAGLGVLGMFLYVLFCVASPILITIAAWKIIF